MTDPTPRDRALRDAVSRIIELERQLADAQATPKGEFR